MKTYSSFPRITRLVFVILIPLALLSLQPGRASGDLLSENHPALTQGDPEENPSHGCHEGTGWRWVTGPQLPKIATQAEGALIAAEIHATIQAHSFGEVDDCGNYRQAGVDFNLALQNQLSPASYASIQNILAALAHPRLGNVILIFPDGQKTNLNQIRGADTKSLTLTNPGWQKIETTTKPSARCAPGLAYDSQNHTALLFGGDNTGSARLDDTWLFDGDNWAQVFPAQSPPGRVNIDQAMVYDAGRGKIVLFGGLSESIYEDDTWEYDGATWQKINTSHRPPGRDAHALVYDPLRGLTVLFGGYNYGARLNDTWIYNGTDWTQVFPTHKPAGRYQHSLAYDSQRNVIVLFGGADQNDHPLGDTWEYNGTDWIQKTPLASPPARHNHGLAFDQERQVTVLFGGQDAEANQLFNDTWEYDGTTWLQIQTAAQPYPRMKMPLTYASQLHALLQFGGCTWRNGIDPFDETWKYPVEIIHQPGVYLKKVFVIVLDPLMSNGETLSKYMGWNDYNQDTDLTIEFFKNASHGRLEYKVVEQIVDTSGWPAKTDGYTYTEQEYLAVLSGQAPPHQPDQVDFNKIVNDPRYDICGKANRGEIDEVWIYNAPYFGFWESTLVGPGAYWYNSPPVPGPYTCERLIPIMGPSYERWVSEAVENFGHRTESAMIQVYGSWLSGNLINHDWDRFTHVVANTPTYTYSGCGNVHFAPNSTSDYDWDNPSTVWSNCDDFYHYPALGDPALTSQPTTCTDWNCQNPDYFHYWYSHFPATTGCGEFAVSNDWWRYIIEPSLANDPGSACGIHLRINYPDGAPGSFFTILGSGFPATSPATLYLNGQPLVEQVITDARGDIQFILDTRNLGIGVYSLLVSVNPQATLQFILSTGAPLRPLEGTGELIVLPGDISTLQSIFLPLLSR